MHRLWHLGYLLTIFVLATALYELWWKEPESLDSSSEIPGETLSFSQQMNLIQSNMILHTNNYSDLTWLGNPIWQPPLDLWILQEAIFEIQPELIIETGTFKGGSSYFFGQVLDLLNKGRVITIDIERLHDLNHPRVTYLIGDSASPEIVRQVRAEAEKTEGPILVILDSDHSKDHVMRELEAYHDLVTPGSYLHVQDGVIDVLPIFAKGRPGPVSAIEEFLRKNDSFELDATRSNKFMITHHPMGWLRRKVETEVR